jgi:tetratricopeptide (TPR) repeat protein
MDTVSFGPFRLYPAERLLKKGKCPVKLGARAAAAAAADTGSFTTQVQLSIQIALASTVLFTGRASDQVKASGTKALELAISLNDIRGQVSAYLVLWGRAVRTPYYQEALDISERCADTATKIADAGPRSMAEWMLGITKHRLGRHAEARLHLQRSLYTDTEMSRQEQLRQIGYDRRTDTLAKLSNLLWLQGLPKEAERMGARAMETATTLGFPVPISVAKAWTNLNRYLSGIDVDVIENDAVELAEHARAHSAGGYQGIGLCILGLCQAQRGQYDDALMLVDEGLKLLDDGRYGIFHPAFRTEFVQAAINADRHSDALNWMGKIDAEDQGSEHWWMPEVLRLKGALALSVDRDTSKAENLFRQSLTLAQKQGSLAWELRTATALSKLWIRQDRRKDALNLLPEICDRFKGVETADLSKARHLLGGLTSPVWSACDRCGLRIRLRRIAGGILFYEALGRRRGSSRHFSDNRLRARPHVDQGIKHQCQESLTGPIRQLAPEDHDGVATLRPQRDALDLRVSRNERSRRHRTEQTNLEGAADHGGDLRPDGLDDQSLVDRERVEAAGNEAAELPPGRRLLVDMDRDGVVLLCEAEDLLLADRIGPKFKSPSYGKIFGIQHQESPARTAT